MLSEREDIAIAEIAVYLPCIVVAIIVALRHGFAKSGGWLYLIIFSGLRIASGAVEIISVHNPTSRDDAAWAAILGSIGLSPLLLALLGLLARVNGFLANNQGRVRIIHILHLPCLLALILAIVGGTDISSTDSSKQNRGHDFEKAGVILFIVTYVGLFAFSLLTMADFRSLPWGEKRILFAILASLPFLAVRLLYSILADFVDNSTFNIIGGNATVQLVMATIEEMIVAVIFLAAGLLAPSLKNVDVGANQFPMHNAQKV